MVPRTMMEASWSRYRRYPDHRLTHCGSSSTLTSATHSWVSNCCRISSASAKSSVMNSRPTDASWNMAWTLSICLFCENIGVLTAVNSLPGFPPLAFLPKCLLFGNFLVQTSTSAEGYPRFLSLPRLRMEPRYSRAHLIAGCTLAENRRPPIVHTGRRERVRGQSTGDHTRNPREQ